MCACTTKTPILCFTDNIKAFVCDIAAEKCMMNQCELYLHKENVVSLLGGIEELDLSDKITHRNY